MARQYWRESESFLRVFNGSDAYDAEQQSINEAASDALLRGRGAFDGPDRLYTEYDMQRKHERWELSNDTLPSTADCAQIEAQVWAIEATDGWERIHRASVSCGLSDRQQSCLQMRFEGYTYDEIAAKLTLSGRASAFKVVYGVYRLLRQHLPQSYEWALWEVLCEVFGGRMMAQAGRDKPGKVFTR